MNRRWTLHGGPFLVAGLLVAGFLLAGLSSIAGAHPPGARPPSPTGSAPAVDAGAFPSKNLVLLSRVDPRSDYNSVWGYRAPDGTEIAIVGTRLGTSFVDPTDPTRAGEYFFLPGAEGHLRDQSNLGDILYLINEDTPAGIQIVSLADPRNPVLLSTYTAAFGTAHTLYVDEDRRRLYATFPDGRFGLTTLDLTDPVNPVDLGYRDLGYVHSVYARDGLVYASLHLEGELVILEDPPPGNPVLTRWYTPLLATHSIWLDEIGTVGFVTDEIAGGHLQLLDLTDPVNPQELSTWSHPVDPGASMHTVIPRGGLAYLSWYRAGYEVLDVSDPRFPSRVGFLDSSPDTGFAFEGAIDIYPRQPSGTIYGINTDTGLHLMEFDPDFGVVFGAVFGAVVGHGEFLEGARVTAFPSGNQVITREGGEYRLSVPSGQVTLQVEHFAYRTHEFSLPVNRGESSKQFVVLDPVPGGSITGTVRESERLETLAGVTVSLVGTPLVTRTDDEGQYRFHPVPSGNHRLRTDDVRFGREELPLRVSDGARLTQNLSLSPTIFFDDFEADRGWTAGLDGDDATDGHWERGQPVPMRVGLRQGMPREDVSPDGTLTFVTENARGLLENGDVDAGRTTLLSPEIAIERSRGPVLVYHRWFVSQSIFGAGTADTFAVDVSTDGGATWMNLETVTEDRAFWERVEIPLWDYLPASGPVRFRFAVVDGGDESIVEAALDDFQVRITPEVLVHPEFVAPPRLLAPMPNPFGSSLTVRFEIAAAGEVSVEVLAVSGRVVETLLDEFLPAGPQEILWSPTRPLAAGVYFLNVRALEGSASTRIVHLHD